MAQSPAQVIVLGGGISGLAAAYSLENSDPHLHITLIEAEPRCGGKIVTEAGDGFLIEGGPDSFLSGKPRGVGLSRELGLGNALLGTTPQQHRAFILFDDRLYPIPEGLTGLVPTRLAPVARSGLLSPTGKARLALDYVLPRREGDGDEGVGAFVRRRLGNQAWERLVEPLMAGIYAADGDQLSLQATFPQLCAAEREYGGLIKGVLAARAAAPASNAAALPPFLTPEAGLGSLVDHLASSLQQHGVTLRTGIAAHTVAASAEGFRVVLANGEVLSADAVVLATPAYASAALLHDLDAALAAELDAIPHASTAIVTLAYRQEEIPRLLDGHGYVVPRIANSPILACTWSSRKWQGRAPQGWELLRIFLGRSGAAYDRLLDEDDAALLALAQAEVAARLGVRTPPALARVQRWPRGMPQYVLGHPERLARINAAVAGHPGLYMTGNAFQGVGIPDCIASGERAAADVVAFLTTKSPDSRHISGNLAQARTGR